MTKQQEIARQVKALAAKYEEENDAGSLAEFCYNLVKKLGNERAKIQEADGMAYFPGLYEGERRVRAKVIDGKYGKAWLIHESEGEILERIGKPFIPVSVKGKKKRKEAGLDELPELAPAAVCLGGSGVITELKVITFRTGDKWGLDSVLAVSATRYSYSY